MKPLVQYLSELNTSDTSWGLYLNPDNIDQYRIGQNCFDNGGLLDNYIFIDNLSNLSFGHQSEREALESILDFNTSSEDRCKATLTYNEKKVVVKKDKLLELYFEDKLDKDFYQFLQNQIHDLMQIWSEWEAEFFVNDTLPEIIEEKLSSLQDDDYEEDVENEELDPDYEVENCWIEYPKVEE